jgi:DNA-binding CsgD family transcriptional regulator
MTRRATEAQRDQLPDPAISLLVGDDLFRLGLAHLLAEEGLEVLREDASGDVLVLDIASFPDHAPALTGEVPVVALVGDTDADQAHALVRGATAAVSRSAPPEVIATAVRAVLAGVAVLPRSARAEVRRVREDRASSELDELLTPREREVLELVAAGCENGEIARRLVVSISTVKNHVGRIMAKLGARNRTHAAAIAAGAASAASRGEQLL